jgi:hypothetical protein
VCVRIHTQIQYAHYILYAHYIQYAHYILYAHYTLYAYYMLYAYSILYAHYILYVGGLAHRFDTTVILTFSEINVLNKRNKILMHRSVVVGGHYDN